MNEQEQAIGPESRRRAAPMKPSIPRIEPPMTQIEAPMTQIEVPMTRIEVPMTRIEISMTQIELSMTQIELSMPRIELSMPRIELSKASMPCGLSRFGSVPHYGTQTSKVICKGQENSVQQKANVLYSIP